MNRAFLSEQAGVLAQTLRKGVPCPVCGALEHPDPAQLSDTAPTEGQLKQAKQTAEQRRKTAEQASLEAQSLRGQKEALERELMQKAAEFWPEGELTELRSRAEAERDTLRTRYSAIAEKITAEDRNIRRKAEPGPWPPNGCCGLSNATPSP